MVPPPTQQQQPSDVDDGKKTEGEDSQLENEDHRKHKQHDPIDSTATGTSDELFTGEDTETDRAGKDKSMHLVCAISAVTALEFNRCFVF